MTNDVRDSKVCPACGRTFEWRKRWARTWPSVRWCSERCRRQRDALARAEQGHPSHEAAILALLAERGAGKTICPSEVLPPDEKQDPTQMEAVRAAARRLVHAGRIAITQRGVVVSPEHARGPIRLRLV
jgi:hypothetical protein